jgi:hypothetical protein
MASLNDPQFSRSSLACATPCLRCADDSRDLDLDTLPDEIDLLQVLWSQIRNYCNEFAPGPRVS